MLDEHATTMDTKAGIDLVSFQEGRGTETGKALGLELNFIFQIEQQAKIFKRSIKSII